mmetsp:Transcript_16341/g.41533  ORF Transcript_16341/g.41533 Transcript_16341/m.41533 type:complete len:225 (+) Transcript_16341:168-842(+)
MYKTAGEAMMKRPLEAGERKACHHQLRQPPCSTSVSACNAPVAAAANENSSGPVTLCTAQTTHNRSCATCSMAMNSKLIDSATTSPPTSPSITNDTMVPRSIGRARPELVLSQLLGALTTDAALSSKQPSRLAATAGASASATSPARRRLPLSTEMRLAASKPVPLPTSPKRVVEWAGLRARSWALTGDTDSPVTRKCAQSNAASSAMRLRSAASSRWARHSAT